MVYRLCTSVDGDDGSDDTNTVVYPLILCTCGDGDVVIDGSDNVTAAMYIKTIPN